MTKQQHPITPPPELVLQWIGEYFGCTTGGELSGSEKFLADRAAQWGADQELEACVKWLETEDSYLGGELRIDRRPKPPSLKLEALLGLESLTARLEEAGLPADLTVLYRALEQLPDNTSEGDYDA